MSAEPAKDAMESTNTVPFRYPEYPWESAAAPGVALFREISTEELLDSGSRWAELPPPAEENPVAVRFEYLAGPNDEGWHEEEPAEPGTPPDRDGESPEAFEARLDPERERHFTELLVSECRKSEERGRGLGFDAGRTQGREEAARQLHADIEGERKRLTAQVGMLIENFAGSREAYVHRLEQESVALALAIAARVLRREAESDPLLLTGAVRVALGQLAASTIVRLVVPAIDAAMWEESLASIPNLAIRPAVVGDARMELGDCRMETELGSADLGLGPQLREIERRLSPQREKDRCAEEGAGSRFGEDYAAREGSICEP